jgi:hypothetical protein
VIGMGRRASCETSGFDYSGVMIARHCLHFANADYRNIAGSVVRAHAHVVGALRRAVSVRQDALIKTAHASRTSQSQRSVAWHADRTWSGPYRGRRSVAGVRATVVDSEARASQNRSDLKFILVAGSACESRMDAWLGGPVEQERQAIETAPICPIYPQTEFLRYSDNAVISRHFYRSLKAATRFAAAMPKG